MQARAAAARNLKMNILVGFELLLIFMSITNFRKVFHYSTAQLVSLRLRHSLIKVSIAKNAPG